jgi:TRAP-type C4-dicarboxylate transport system substrate-binding protein
MSVTLTPEVQQFVDKQVAEENEKRNELIADLEQGLQSLKAGMGLRTTAKEILAEMKHG